ncbi:MAG: WYL domain-containing protein [Cryomorphaceae bacterium]|nr:MAG: WYL domain-containing protein [Cryomorphaceae bacterium]
MLFSTTMSSIHGTLRRYYLIIEKLKRKAYPSLRELRDFLHEQGFEIAERTLQRDIEQLRVEFDVSVIYDRSQKGYFIEAESMSIADRLLDFAAVPYFSGMLTETLKSGAENLRYLSFERGSEHRGMEHFTPLLDAVSRNTQVQIVHTAFHRDEPKEYTVLPFMLKEYQRRWYLVGYVPERNDFRSFGIDRIETVQRTNIPFSRNDYPDPAVFFNDVIGLTYSTADVAEVELSFHPFQGNYVKALPLHASQVEVADDDKEYRIRLRVRPNFELTQVILGYGDSVKVCKPASLAKEIKERLDSARKNYR